MYSKNKMKSALESMMFVLGEPLSVKDAAEVLSAEKNEIKELFLELQKEYAMRGSGLRLREVDGAFQFVTYSENEIYISKLCTPVKVKKLSQAALEVLAIIAYRQPVTKGEIDSIRGIKSERVIDGLINKALVEVCGRSDAVGRPLLYRTTKEFLKQFGFTSIKDLPDITEFDDISEYEEGTMAAHEQLSLNFDDTKEINSENK